MIRNITFVLALCLIVLTITATGLMCFEPTRTAILNHFGYVESTIKNGENGQNGIDGTDGQNGNDGENGNDGQDGENGIDGKSAYEIAVEYGFTGTEQEWLDYLKGIDGLDGVNGIDGQNGKDGDGMVSYKTIFDTTPISNGYINGTGQNAFIILIVERQSDHNSDVWLGMLTGADGGASFLANSKIQYGITNSIDPTEYSITHSFVGGAGLRFNSPDNMGWNITVVVLTSVAGV